MDDTLVLMKHSNVPIVLQALKDFHKKSKFRSCCKHLIIEVMLSAYHA